jgi:predicted nucleotidyltransferase
MENLNLLLKRLLDNKVDFVLIGGYAAVLHGSSQVTHDLDICAVMTDEELVKLKTALKDLNPQHRMNKNFQPRLEDFPKPDQKLDNYYLKTSAGILDIISCVNPVGSFQDIKKNAVEIKIFGNICRVISLDDLIKVKQSMTRDKDKIVLNDLLVLKQKLRK